MSYVFCHAEQGINKTRTYEKHQVFSPELTDVENVRIIRIAASDRGAPAL